MLVEKAVAVVHGGYSGLEREIPTALVELTGWHPFPVWLPKKSVEVSLAILRAALAQKALRVFQFMGTVSEDAAPLQALVGGHGS